MPESSPTSNVPLESRHRRFIRRVREHRPWRSRRARIVLLVTVLLFFVAGFGLGLAWQRSSRLPANGPSQETGNPQNELSEKLQKGYETARGLRFGNQDAAAQLADAHTVDQATAALQSFLKQYNLTLETTHIQPSWYAKEYSTYKSLDTSDLAELKSYGAMFIDEWSKYPLDWVQDSGLQKVVLVTDLKVSDVARAAMPDPIGDVVYYDIDYGTGQYAREVVHHEYNHVIEYNFYNTYNRPDSQWESFNPAGFTYGAGGAAAYDDPYYRDRDHPSPGFVSEYAKYAIEEDKAELYAYLMTDNQDELAEWIKTDTALNKKVQYYQQFMRSITPEMTDNYFDAINP